MEITIGTLWVNKLLDDITDYDEVILTDKEIEKLYQKCKYMDSSEDIEREINRHLEEIGFTFDTKEFLWIRGEHYDNYNQN